MSRPVYGLVDFDPDGIGILSTYKRGSKRLAHETAELSCPTMHWIGLKSGDILSSTDTHQVQGLLKLSGRDRRRASRMLMREPLDENGEEPVWRREVQVMLMLNIKAEIQLLDARKGGMGSWLDAHMNLHG
jgi:meiotic recombination protein SPO11